MWYVEMLCKSKGSGQINWDSSDMSIVHTEPTSGSDHALAFLSRSVKILGRCLSRCGYRVCGAGVGAGVGKGGACLGSGGALGAGGAGIAAGAALPVTGVGAGGVASGVNLTREGGCVTGC